MTEKISTFNIPVPESENNESMVNWDKDVELHPNDGMSFAEPEAEPIDKNSVENIDIDKIKSRKVGRFALFSLKDDRVAKAA